VHSIYLFYRCLQQQKFIIFIFKAKQSKG